jgi:hypothetical protein
LCEQAPSAITVASNITVNNFRIVLSINVRKLVPQRATTA